MKNLLFILPIMALSFSLQAQQSNPDSDERELILNSIDKDYITSYLPTKEEENNSEQFTSVEKEFLDVVRAGNILGVTDAIDLGFMNGEGIYLTSNDELGEEALTIAMANGDVDMVEVLWERGARMEDEDGTSLTLEIIVALAETFRNVLEWNVLSYFESKIRLNPDSESIRIDSESIRTIDRSLLDSIRRSHQDIRDKIFPCDFEDADFLRSLMNGTSGTREEFITTLCGELIRRPSF